MRSTDDDAIRARVNQLFDERGWVQKETAREIGVEASNLHRYLRGTTTKIPASFVAALCQKRRISTRWMLTGQGRPEEIELATAERIVKRIMTMLEEEV